MKYNAFISYSHRQKPHLAESLETALEKFAKPLLKPRALAIFRDANDLSASPDLWGKIVEGLKASDYFIFMGSKASAQSIWCQKEVEYWRANKSMDNFLLVLMDGELVWEDSTADFDWSKTTAIPKNLSGAFKSIPLYVDFTADIPPDKLNLDYPDFKTKVVLLAATIHGKSVGDMVGEAARQHKRIIRLRNATLATLSVLLCAAIGLAIFAFGQTKIAESEAKKALFANYIANIQNLTNENPTKALRLAEYAYQYARENEMPVHELKPLLIKLFYGDNGFYQDPENPIPTFEAESVPVQHFEDPDFTTFKSITDRIKEEARVNYPTYFNTQYKDGILLDGGSAMGFPLLYYFREWYEPFKLTDTVVIRAKEFGGPNSKINSYDISTDGKYSIFGTSNGTAVLIDNKDYTRNNDVYKYKAVLNSNNFPLRELFFTKTKGYVATLYYDTQFINDYWTDLDSTLLYWKIEPFPFIEIDSDNTKEVSDAKAGGYSLQSIGDRSTSGEENSLEHFFLNPEALVNQDDSVIATFPNIEQSSSKKHFSPDSTVYAIFSGLYTADNQLLIPLNLDRFEVPEMGYCFSADGNFFKLSNIERPERIFALDPAFILNRVNDTTMMGSIAKLTAEDKKRFLIKE